MFIFFVMYMHILQSYIFFRMRVCESVYVCFKQHHKSKRLYLSSSVFLFVRLYSTWLVLCFFVTQMCKRISSISVVPTLPICLSLFPFLFLQICLEVFPLSFLDILFATFSSNFYFQSN